LKKLQKKIRELHPNSSKENIRRFLIALFGNTRPEAVCELYKRLFETKEEETSIKEETPIKEEENNDCEKKK